MVGNSGPPQTGESSSMEYDDENCRQGISHQISSTKEPPRLPWASDFFLNSHWSRCASSTSSSGRCNSRESSNRSSSRGALGTETHEKAVRLKKIANSDKPPSVPNRGNEIDKDFKEANLTDVTGALGLKVPAAAASSRKALTASVQSSELPTKHPPASPKRTATKASLVCGPLAVQETLTERQLHIERRMMELRKQNRRRLHRRQQEAKQQQQQHAKEQHAALLARRQRLKLASLWKERGMAAAAKPPGVPQGKKSSAILNSSDPKDRDGVGSSAEELLAALVISESIDIQQVDSARDADDSKERQFKRIVDTILMVLALLSSSGEELYAPHLTLNTGGVQPEAHFSSGIKVLLGTLRKYGKLIGCVVSSGNNENVTAGHGHLESQGTWVQPAGNGLPAPLFDRLCEETASHFNSWQSQELRFFPMSVARALLNLQDTGKASTTPLSCTKHVLDPPDTHASQEGSTAPILQQRRRQLHAVPHPCQSTGDLYEKRSSRKLLGAAVISQACGGSTAKNARTRNVERRIRRKGSEAARHIGWRQLRLEEASAVPQTQEWLLGLCIGDVPSGSKSLIQRSRENRASTSTSTLAVNELQRTDLPIEFQSPFDATRPMASEEEKKAESEGPQSLRRRTHQAVVVVSDPALKKQLELKLLHQNAQKQQRQRARQVQSSGSEAVGLHKKQHATREKFDSTENMPAPDDAETELLEERESVDLESSQSKSSKASSKQDTEPASPSLPHQDALADKCAASFSKPREVPHSQANTQSALQAATPQGAEGAKDSQVPSDARSGQLSDDSKPSDGAARAQAAGLHFVRVFSPAREFFVVEKAQKAFLEQEGRCPAESIGGSPVRNCSSRLQWQACAESQSIQNPAGAPNEWRSDQECSSSSLSSGQEFECQPGSFDPTADIIGDPKRRSLHGCMSHSVEVVKKGCRSAGIKDGPPQRAKHGDSTTLAVLALEEAQQLEERRLLLLEVSHHAIEKQAENRKREMASFQRSGREQTQQCSPESLASLVQKQRQQGDQAELSGKPSLAAEATRASSTLENAKDVVPQSQLRELPVPGSILQSSLQLHQQLQLNRVSRVGQNYRTPHKTFASASSRASAMNGVKPAVSSKHARLSELATTKAEATGGQIHTLAQEGHSTPVQNKQHYDLLQQQQSLLQQLLQECISDRASTPEARELKAKTDKGSEATLMRLQSRVTMQPREILQAVQGLLLPQSGTASQSPAAGHESTIQKQSSIYLPQRQRGGQILQKSQASTAAAANTTGEAPNHNRRRSTSCSPSYSLRMFLPSRGLRLSVKERQKQQEVEQHSLSASLFHEVLSVPNKQGIVAASTQALREQQQPPHAAPSGPLLAALRQRLFQRQQLTDSQLLGCQKLAGGGAASDNMVKKASSRGSHLE
ncbi:hypothetical protein Efla_001325 [Eimeria flavescens]